MAPSAWRRIVSIGFMLLIWASTDAHEFRAQESTDAMPSRVRVVGVITGPELNSASPNVTAEDGLSQFSEILRDLGATVSVIPPDREIPPDVELVVLVRPQRALSVTQIAHLWHFLERGGHFLLAIDPVGHNGGITESARTSGFDRLLQAEYGLGVADNLLVEDWFGLESLGDVSTSWSDIRPDDLFPHDITGPLIRYGLPLRYWGGRSLLVDGFTGYATAEPLVFTESPYGETARVNFGNGDVSQISRNIGPDTQGRLLVGGLATNIATGSRIAVIGDSEIFQNAFGLRRRSERDTAPLYIANEIFAQRLLAWLMAVPDAEYPGLSERFTWIALDGDGSDWPADLPGQGGLPSPESPYALQQIRAFQNDHFVYVLLETHNPLPRGTLVYLFLDDATGSRQLISIDMEGHVRSGDTQVADASAAAGSTVEIRLPRRLFSTDTSEIARVCVGDPSGSAVDCFEESVRPVDTNSGDPLPVRFSAGPQAYTIYHDTNLRARSTQQSTSLAKLPSRTLFAVTGRNADGDWVYVKNGRYEGWINRSILMINADVSRLPNVEE